MLPIVNHGHMGSEGSGVCALKSLCVISESKAAHPVFSPFKCANYSLQQMVRCAHEKICVDQSKGISTLTGAVLAALLK